MKELIRYDIDLLVKILIPITVRIEAKDPVAAQEAAQALNFRDKVEEFIEYVRDHDVDDVEVFSMRQV